MSDVPGSATDRYIVVSADGHAGLACEDYRPYLEPRYHPAFEEYLAERTAHREESLAFNYDYIMGWETDNEEGLKGAFDPSVHDKELDSDGVAADVLFADADAVTGMASPPSAPDCSPGRSPTPSWPSPGPTPTTCSWPRCAPTRRTAGAASPWCPSPTTSTVPSARSSGWRPSPASAAS